MNKTNLLISGRMELQHLIADDEPVLGVGALLPLLQLLPDVVHHLFERWHLELVAFV